MSSPKRSTSALVQLPAPVRAMTHRLTAKVVTHFSQVEAEHLRTLRQRLLEFSNASKDATEAQVRHWNMARQFMDRDASQFGVAFLKALEKGIEDDLQSILRKIQSEPKAGAKLVAPNTDFLDGLSFSLVGADEMDRMLMRDRVMQRFNSRYEEVLNILNQRLRFLLNADSANVQNNPYRPEILIQALCAALKSCAFEDAASQDLLLAMDPKHWVDLKPLYQELCETLVESGATVDKPRVRKSAGVDSGAAWTPAEPGATGAATGYGNTQPGALPSAFGQSGFADVRSLRSSALSPGIDTGFGGSAVSAGYGDAPWMAPSHARAFLHQLGARPSVATMVTGSSATGSAWPAFSTTHFGGVGSVEPYLISYLENLQAQAIEAMAIGGFDFNSHDQNVLHDIRSSGQFSHAQELERGTLDALAEVFDFVFNDAAIPAPLKVIIGRLQIPVLKAAMLDRAFFLSPNHPARRLIDALAAASVAWSGTDSVDDPLFLQIESSVKRVLNEFDQDLALFGEVLLEFEAFLTNIEANATQQVKRVATEEEVAEALDAARRHIDTLLHERTAALAPERSATALLLPFLTHQWREVLARGYLNRTAKPDDWARLQTTTDQLIWSTEKKTDTRERRQLVSSLPGLVQQLNASLDELGWRGPDRESFTKRLLTTHMNALRSGADAAPETAPNPLERQLSDEAVRNLDARLAHAQQAQDPAAVAALSDLDRGMWFDYVNEHGQTQRCRLTWISPGRTRFLFTNRDGFDAFVAPELQVRQWLQQGRLRTLSQAPLVGRAIDQILGDAEIDIPT